jgi:predicted GIY-YIG superfamily endonuclease
MVARLFVLILALAGTSAACSAAAFEARPVPAYTQTLVSRFENHTGGKYFQFHGDLPPQRLALYAAFSDMFVELVDQEFSRVKTRFPIQAIVLADKGSFKAFLRNALGVQMPPEYGIYVPGAAVFVTYDGSGLGTFTHEIMHPLVEESLPDRPAWAMEGIPAFFEKFYGHVKNGRLHVQWGYQNPWRIEMLGPRLKSLKLEHIVNGSQDTSEKRLVTVYLSQRGKLKTFLELVQANDRRGFATHLEAAFGKPLKEIEKDWKTYLEEIESSRQQIMRLPTSRLFDTPDQYRLFAEQFNL